eukprot:m.77590 g.77590  ORF g.77590 m.77590 type:complete len:302 (+) comp8140_c0_seq2:3336-4241(+)
MNKKTSFVEAKLLCLNKFSFAHGTKRAHFEDSTSPELFVDLQYLLERLNSMRLRLAVWRWQIRDGLAEKRADALLSALWNDAKIISALERHCNAALGKRHEHTSHVAICGRGDGESAKSVFVADSSIKARRNEDHVRLKGLGNRHDNGSKGCKVLCIAHATSRSVPRDVQIVPAAVASASLKYRAGAGVKGALIMAMNGDVEHVVPVVKLVLDAVAVVYVPIHNQDLLGEAILEEAFCGDGHVVKVAKAHGTRLAGMVARRADNGEAILVLATRNGQGDFHNRADGKTGSERCRLRVEDSV